MRRHATIQGDVLAEFLSKTNEPLAMNSAMAAD
jgi:hypothetical protein